MFKTLIGNLFDSKAQTLVNTVNTVGVMGKGVALEFKNRYPAMFEDYVKRCNREQVKLGEPYLYRDLAGAMIVNFPTKGHWRSPSRLVDIESGLDYFVAHYAAWGVTSIAFPPLGCGNGGLEWSEVGPMMYSKLHSLPIPIEVYAPYGTPKSELTAEFLGGPTQMSLGGRGRKHEKMSPESVVLVEVLRELSLQPYAPPVGRVIFQKICYVLTEMGVNTGFKFGRGSYGPFSNDVKQTLHDFANRNWLQEQQFGQMLVLRVGAQYEKERGRFEETIALHRKCIEKTVDLFSRIKNTDQAEELVTVLYASRELKKVHPNDEIAEQDLLDYVLDWKKAWRAEPKQHAVALAIRSLVMLGWIKLRFSETLPEAV